VFSYARSKEKLNRLARNARGNARAGTPKEATQGADTLLLAVHWSRIDDVLNQTGDLAGKLIVSCSLPLNAANTELVLGHTTSGAEALVKKVPGAEVVSAFNNIPSEVLFGVFEAQGKATPPSMVYCGDTQAGKDIAATLIREVGFDPIDAGPLRKARYTERSPCSSPTSRMEEPKDQSWPTASSGLGKEDDSTKTFTIRTAVAFSRCTFLKTALAFPALIHAQAGVAKESCFWMRVPR
jgi:predicted dinucleotide-binding enzyme